jgi:hypothetical protein
MDDALRGAGWIIVVAICAAYVTYVMTDSVFGEKQSKAKPMIIRDAIRNEEHHLTGTLYVEHSCEQLSTNSRAIAKGEYEIVFTTWPDSAVRCIEGSYSRSFDTVVFADTRMPHFTATLDGKEYPIVVFPSIQGM